MMVRQHFANGIVRRGECIDQVENIGEIAPEVLFFTRTKAERRSSSLLGQAGTIARLQSMTPQFVAEPAKSFCRQIVPEKLHCIGIRQIQFGIAIKASEPAIPVLVLEDTDQLCELTDRRVRVVLHRLPEMLRGIVGRSVKSNAFLDRIPVREYPSLN